MGSVTYRKTGKGEWVAYGPAATMKTGSILVRKASGETKAEHVERLGKPFTVNGTQMVYGYLGQAPMTEEEAAAQWAAPREPLPWLAPGATGGTTPAPPAAPASKRGACDGCQRGHGARPKVTLHLDYDRSGEERYLCGPCSGRNG